MNHPSLRRSGHVFVAQYLPVVLVHHLAVGRPLLIDELAADDLVLEADVDGARIHAMAYLGVLVVETHHVKPQSELVQPCVEGGAGRDDFDEPESLALERLLE